MALNKLKGKMRELGITNKEMADTLKVSPSTFSAKLNGKYEFSRKEISVMGDFMKLSKAEIADIFF